MMSDSGISGRKEGYPNKNPIAFGLLIFLFFFLASALPLIFLKNVISQTLLTFGPLLLKAFAALLVIYSLKWFKDTGFSCKWKALWALIPLGILVFLNSGEVFSSQLTLALSTVVEGFFFGLLTAIGEESIFRGIILRTFLPFGVLKSVLVTSILFGFWHITLLSSSSPPYALIAIIGAFLIGIFFASIRLSMNTIIPLIVAHTLIDWASAVVGNGQFKPPPLAVYATFYIGFNLIFALVGIYLLRHYKIGNPATLSESSIKK
jgi:membrane protease YdiL (CAAX protease family)